MSKSENKKSKTKSPEGAVKKKISKRMIALIVALPLVIATTVFATVMLTLKMLEKPEPEQRNSGNLIMTQENYLEIGAEVAEKVARGMFETHMNTTWTFPDGKSPSTDAVMGNAASNNYDFYFTVTLVATGEIVLESGLLPVGSQMAEVKLDKELAEGTYDAMITIYMVDEDMNPIESNMGFDITLVIKS